MLGKEMFIGQQKQFSAGSHTIELDVSKFPNGIYYLTLNGENTRTVKKMVVEK